MMNNQQTSQLGQKRSNSSVYSLVLLSLFTGIIILMACTPIGLIDLPFIKATILHIPVIIGAILLGPKQGAFLGFVFGLTSLIKNTMVPGVLSFTFSPLIPVPGTDHGSLWAIVISLLPRMLIGPIAWAVYVGLKRLFQRLKGGQVIGMVAAGIIGAFVNSALVMSLIFFLFKDAYAAANNLAIDAVLAAILGVVATNGVPEMIAAAILVPAITVPLSIAMKRSKRF